MKEPMVKRRLVPAMLLLAAGLAAPQGALAQTASPSASSTAVPATSVAQAMRRTISIGGDLKQWDGLPRYAVTLSNGVPSVPVKQGGYYSVAYDDKNLYLLGVFEQPKGTVLARLPANAPEWWNDDVEELYLRPAPFAAVPTDLHFATNPAGTRFGSYTATTDYKSAGRIENDRWVLEVALPLGAHGLPTVKSGDIWGLKVGRENQKAAEYPIWPVGGDFSSPNTFGYLAFSDKPQDSAVITKTITDRLGRSPAGAPISSRLSDIGSYAVYYGKDAADVAQLSNYDLAIVQSYTLTAPQLKTLHDNGTRVVAYLTIGELDKNSPYAGQVAASWVLGKNANWGSKFIDASQPGWQKIVSAEAADLMKQGYDGVFLDTLDTADLYPQAGPGLVKIVQNLRATYPDALIVQNRGFGLLKQTAPSIDAVMFENFSSGYDFKTSTYGAVNGDPSFVQALSARGLKVLALDYAQPGQTTLISNDYQRAKAYGFVPYVSTINLDRVYTANP